MHNPGASCKQLNDFPSKEKKSKIRAEAWAKPVMSLAVPLLATIIGRQFVSIILKGSKETWAGEVEGGTRSQVYLGSQE